MEKSLVLLHNVDSLSLIVRAPSGIVYQNQVGGQLCVPAEQEGALVPIDISLDDLSELLSFDFPQGGQGLDAKTVRFLEHFLASKGGCSFIAIESERVGESYEAWVYVRVGQVPSSFDPNAMGPYGGNLYGLSGATGVLTWPNSD